MCWGLFCVLSCGLSENFPCAFEKNVHFASLGWKLLCVSVKFIWFRALFIATTSLLIFYLEDLFIFYSGVLKSPTIIVLLSISFLKSFKIFFMFFCFQPFTFSLGQSFVLRWVSCGQHTCRSCFLFHSAILCLEHLIHLHLILLLIGTYSFSPLCTCVPLSSSFSSSS